MQNFNKKVVVGNIMMRPDILRKYLAKSHYFMKYDTDKEMLEFNANHGAGGETLFEIRNVSYESAIKLAEGLGLKGDGASPLHWGKWNPVMHLNHDGSEDAEQIRLELLRLNIPHTVAKESGVLALTFHPYTYQAPHYDVVKMLEAIRDTAEAYKDHLNTTP